MNAPPTLSLSIVSHQSGRLIAQLLGDLNGMAAAYSQIVITINVPEDESYLRGFEHLPITVVRNGSPKGFGENHNQAFQQSTGSLFAVVNPDIRLRTSPFELLTEAALGPGVGVCAPLVLSPTGAIEDSVRRFPTVGRLAARVLLNRRRPDYRQTAVAKVSVDWAAGMFMVFSRNAFARVGGFDKRYFMYFEDADICRRLWASGLSVQLIPGAEVVHNAQRNSHRNAQHMRWHLRSAARFLLGV